MAESDFWDLRGGGNLGRTGLAQICTTSFPKHCNQRSWRVQGLGLLSTWKLCFPHFNFCLAWSTAVQENWSQCHCGSFHISSEAHVSPLTKHDGYTQEWNINFPENTLLVLRSDSGAFSLRQCGRGLSPILAIFWKKQLPSLATSLCSLRPWAPSTYDSLVAEQVTHPHISTNPKPRDTVEMSSVFLPKTWKSQKSFLSIFTLFTYMSKSEILPAFHRFSQGTTDTKLM